MGQFEYDWQPFIICNAILRYTGCTGAMRPRSFFASALTAVIRDCGRTFKT
jgi:hypothetical protein